MDGQGIDPGGVAGGIRRGLRRREGYGEQGLALTRHLDNPQGITFSLVILGTIAVAGQRGDIPAASLLDEARSLLPMVRDARIRAQLLDLDGAMALITGDAERTVSLWEQSRRISRGLGNAYGEAISLANLGLLAVRMGDDRAEGLLQDGLQLGLELDYKLVIQYCWTGLGALAAAGGRLARAARLWGAAEGIGETFGTQLTRAARAVIDYERPTRGGPAHNSTMSRGTSPGPKVGPWIRFTWPATPRSPRPPATVHLPGGLSPREAEILGLVAEGSTNAEVAQQLFLSPRTVDWHLSSIYTKLDIHSRARGDQVRRSTTGWPEHLYPVAEPVVLPVPGATAARSVPGVKSRLARLVQAPPTYRVLRPGLRALLVGLAPVRARALPIPSPASGRSWRPWWCCRSPGAGRGVGLLRRMVRWRVGPGWYAVALLLPVARRRGRRRAQRPARGAASVRQRAGRVVGGLATFLLVLLIPGFGGAWEEPGWRGTASPRCRPPARRSAPA